MSSIFEKIKPFEFIAEAEAAAAPPPENYNFIYVKLNGDRFSELDTEMRKYDAVDVTKFPANNTDNKYVVMMDARSNDSGIKQWISKSESENRLEQLRVDKDTYDSLYNYYGQKIRTDYNEINSWMNENPEPDPRSASAMKNRLAAFNRLVGMVEPHQTNSPDVDTRKEQRRQFQAYKQTIADHADALKKTSDQQLNNIRQLLSSINYEDKELAIKKLSDVMVAIKTLKSHGELDPIHEGALLKRVDDARKKLGMDAEKFNSVMQSGAGETLAAHVMSFIHTEQKDAEQIADEYAAVMEAIESQKNALEPDTYKNLKQIMENEMTTKIAILKALEEREKMPVKDRSEDGAKPSEKGDVEISAANATGSVYTIKVQLPLGRTVTVTDIEKFKGEPKSKIGEKPAGAGSAASDYQDEREILKGAILARTEVSLFNLMGYRPKGVASYVIDSYDPLRRHVGEVMQVAARDTAGLLLSVFGKNGRELGEGLGRVLKHELIGNPLDVNPALAQGEMWLRNKFNLFPKSEVGRIRKGAHLLEDAAPGMAPGMPASGTTPGGDGMNVPGMIGGMGDPVAPTRDKPGSGDNFNPPAKKKKKKDREHSVSDFYSFMNRLNVNK